MHRASNVVVHLSIVTTVLRMHSYLYNILANAYYTILCIGVSKICNILGGIDYEKQTETMMTNITF